LKRYGGLDQIAFADIPRPALKPGEILIRLHAAGLNPIDNMIPKGTFKPIRRFQLPATLWFRKPKIDSAQAGCLPKKCLKLPVNCLPLTRYS
jgi:hypothetical protein